MGFAKTAPKIVMFLNTLTMIMGIVMLAGAIYVWTIPEYSLFFPAYSIWVAGAAGLFIFLVSFLGCFSVYKDYRKLLGLYTLLVFCILAMQIAGAVLYAGYFNYISAGAISTFNIKSLSDQIAISINNNILSVYTVCCTGCFVGAGCTAPYNVGVNTTTANCPPIGPIPTCELPQPCASALDTLTDQGTCYKAPPSGSLVIPSFKVDPTICTNLALTKVNSDANAPYFVGPKANGSCGGGKSFTFQSQVYVYARSKLVWVLGIASVVAALEFLLLFASIAAFCAKRERKN